MTISSSNNFFNQISSNLSKTTTNNNSFKIHKEDKTEITAFTKKIEGDYSTYTAKELSALSYKEVQENYEEIKEVLESRMKKAQDVLNSDSFKNYQKELLRNGNYEIRGASKEQEIVNFEINTEGMELIELQPEGSVPTPVKETYKNINTKEYNEIQDLLNFNDKFKIVNFFDNDEINEAIYSNYEDNSQVYYEEPHVSDLDGANWGFNAGSAYSIQGTDLKAILQSIEDAKEFIGKHGVQVERNDGSYSKGYLINGDEISIAGKIFSIYDVNKNFKGIEASQEVEKDNESEIIKETTMPDYSSYNIEQLRQIPFDEAKENYDELLKILKNALENTSNLNEEELDNLLAFKAQLEKVNYTDNDELNEIIYNKLQDIEDPKVAVWSNLVITENIKNLQDGKISSFVLGGIAFSEEDITKINNTSEDNKKEKEEKAQKNTAQTGTEHVNLDYIINTVSVAVANNQSTQNKPYSKEYIEAYSNFTSQYNAIKDSTF